MIAAANRPDLCFFNKKKSKNFRKGQSSFPAPDLVIEILSKQTEARDRGIKFEDYQNHQIEEYWIIDPKEEVVEQYHLEKGKYELKLKSGNGQIASYVIEGFAIPVRAIFDKKENLKTLQTIIMD